MRQFLLSWCNRQGYEDVKHLLEEIEKPRLFPGLLLLFISKLRFSSARLIFLEALVLLLALGFALPCIFLRSKLSLARFRFLLSERRHVGLFHRLAGRESIAARL